MLLYITRVCTSTMRKILHLMIFHQSSL